MFNISNLKTLIFSSLLAAALCFGYWKYRGVDARHEELQRSLQSIEQVREEVRSLEIRLEQTRARVKALENDPVEAEAAARRIGRTVRSKSEIVFHLDESALTGPVPAAPAGAAPEGGTASPAPSPATAPAPSPVLQPSEPQPQTTAPATP